MPLPNPMQGEAALGEHKLVVKFGRWCALEAELGMKVPAILALMEGGLGFTDLRTFVRAFCDVSLTEEEANDAIDVVGFPAALEAVSKAVNGYFAERKETAARPQKAA